MSYQEMEHTLLEEVSGSQLMEHAAYIDAEDRESGSAGERRAAEYFRSVMTKHGLATQIHYVENYISLPINGYLRLGNKQELACITHSYAVSTGEAGVSAKAVCYPEEKDVSGKIAVIRGLASPPACKDLAQRGAVGVICINSGDYPFNMAISPVWGMPMPQDLALLPRIPVVSVNRADGQVLVDYLNNSLGTVFLRTEVSTKFRVVPICVAELKAAEPTDRFVLFGGHVDAWHKGGTDNGGSNAVVLELARVLSGHRAQLNTNIRFVWWSGHSNGRYSGSNWYADYHWEDLHRNAVVNVDIDLVGAQGSTSFRYMECSKQCYEIGRRCIHDQTGQQPSYARIQRNGDQSFWAHGVPSLFEVLSLQPEEKQGGGTFIPGLPWFWHTICDTFDKLGEAELLRDAQIYLRAIWRFAAAPAYPFCFSDLVAEMKKNLTDYEKTAAGSFDLSELQQAVDRLGELLAPVDAQIHRLNGLEEPKQADNDAARQINNLSMRLNRLLIPVHYCKNGDPFQVDPALTIPPFSGLEPLGQLAVLDRDSNEFKFLERQLVRERNRIFHSLDEAVRLLTNSGAEEEAQ